MGHNRRGGKEKLSLMQETILCNTGRKRGIWKSQTTGQQTVTQATATASKYEKTDKEDWKVTIIDD